MFFYVLLIALLLINLLIVFTGKTYLYKGISSTYLRGKKSPTIYDLDTFPCSKIEKGKRNDLPHAANYNTFRLTKAQRKLHRSLGTTSFLVLKNGELVYEKYFNKHTKEMKTNSFSIAKSLVGILVFVALEEGFISSLDDNIAKYLSFFDEKKNITIRHLLTMSSGMKWSESGLNPLSENAEAYYTSKLDEFMTTISYAGQPGKVFDYKSGNSQLLGMLLKEVTGKSVSKYAEEKIWTKIGAESSAHWSLDHEDGTEKTFCCLYATSLDYLRLGNLILNDGLINGHRILSKKSINELLSLPNNLTEAGRKNLQYTNHIWKYKNIDYFRGLFGQYIMIDKVENLVVVRTGHRRMDKFLIDEENVAETQENLYKDGHPKDLFIYLRMAKEIVAQ